MSLRAAVAIRTDLTIGHCIAVRTATRNEATTGGRTTWPRVFTRLLNWWAPAQSLRDLRVAEVVELDMQITDGKVEAYRAKVKVSFKFEEHQ